MRIPSPKRLPRGVTISHNLGAYRAPKETKRLQVVPAVDAAQLARRSVEDPQAAAAEPLALGYLAHRYMRPILCRTYERRAASVAAFPLRESSKAMGAVWVAPVRGVKRSYATTPPSATGVKTYRCGPRARQSRKRYYAPFRTHLLSMGTSSSGNHPPPVRGAKFHQLVLNVFPAINELFPKINFYWRARTPSPPCAMLVRVGRNTAPRTAKYAANTQLTNLYIVPTWTHGGGPFSRRLRQGSNLRHILVMWS